MIPGLDPTYLGTVTGVSGATVTVRLAKSLASGIAVIGGQTYRVGQVGSFVRVPQGYQDLYGIVTEIGASPNSAISTTIDDERWLHVELCGETIGGRFERGISQHPNISDSVHLVVERDLQQLYSDQNDDQIEVGSLSSAENIAVRLGLNALVTRHSSILGSTGSGKSTTVASLLRSIVSPTASSRGSGGARILLLDLHGEYSAALKDVSKIFSATPTEGEESLCVPFWALNSAELLAFVAGNLSENHQTVFADKIHSYKVDTARRLKYPGLDENSITTDTPIPFSLQKLWYELVDFELATFSGANKDQPQLVTAGDPKTLKAPIYRAHAMGSAGPFLNQAAKGIRRPLDLMRSRLLDRRYNFLLHPGEWEPGLDGNVSKDLDSLLQAWLGHEKPITIFDLSGVPSTSLVRLVGSVLKIVYEALFWSREKSEGGFWRPLLVVMEEAHRYLAPKEESVASEIVQRIVKEGRKYGIGAMVVSQRPAEVDETILSQCGTLVCLRLSNPTDRARVKGALPDNLSGLMDLLPVLRTGEAVIVGESARLPVRCRVTLPKPHHRPRSVDPDVSEAWSSRRVAEGYDRVAASWRAQDTRAVAKQPSIKRLPVKSEER
mgnify:CR=1 FL=1